LMAAGTISRFSFISTTPAAVTAIADPLAPIASPTWAAARAVESLMPSPAGRKEGGNAFHQSWSYAASEVIICISYQSSSRVLICPRSENSSSL
jgi:hypothetical protein